MCSLWMNHFHKLRNSIETRKMTGLALPKKGCDWTSEWLVISSLVSRDEPKRWVAFNQAMAFFHEGQQECPFPHLLRPTAIFVGWIQTQEGLLFSVRSSFQKHGVGLFIFQSEKGCYSSMLSFNVWMPAGNKMGFRYVHVHSLGICWKLFWNEQ